MGKDPAVLFYTSDFLAGTSFFTMEQRGQYITLLCEQHQLGGIPEAHLLDICKSKSSPVWAKFQKGQDGLWFNPRMREEAIKRRSFVDSRHKNAIKGGRPKASENLVDNHKDKLVDNHKDTLMGNENGNDNKGKNKNKKTNSHAFDKSHYFDKKLFQDELGIDIHEASFWWHSLYDWSLQGNKYKNWLVTARTWKRNAEAKGDNRHKAHRIPNKKNPIKQIVHIEDPKEELGKPDGFEMPEFLIKKVPKNDESIFEKKKRFLKQGG